LTISRSEILSLAFRATTSSSSDSTRPESRKRRRSSPDKEVIEVDEEVEEVIPKPSSIKRKKSSPIPGAIPPPLPWPCRFGPDRGPFYRLVGSVECPLCSRTVPEVTSTYLALVQTDGALWRCLTCFYGFPQVNQHLDSSCQKFLSKPTLVVGSSSRKSSTKPASASWSNIFSGGGSSSCNKNASSSS
jgi:hypothetical protein